MKQRKPRPMLPGVRFMVLIERSTRKSVFGTVISCDDEAQMHDVFAAECARRQPDERVRALLDGCVVAREPRVSSRRQTTR